MKSFGEYVRDKRLEKYLGIREFCEQTNYVASDWSKVERGLMRPPSNLQTIINVLELSEEEIQVLCAAVENFEFRKPLSEEEIMRDKLPWNWPFKIAEENDIKNMSEEEFKGLFAKVQTDWLNVIKPMHEIEDREPNKNEQRV